MTNAVIVQARMGSSRYPGKMLAPLAGKPVIFHVLDRALDSEVGTVVLATTIEPTDHVMVRAVQSEYGDRVRIYRGLARNVLHRFWHASGLVRDAGVIVRLTGDCPLVDPRMIVSCVDHMTDHVEHMYRGVTNSPDGNDVEVMTDQALMSAYVSASAGYDTEHVTPWIRENYSADLVSSVRDDPAFTDVRYSINTVDDLLVCQQLIDACGEGARWQDYVAAYRRIASVPAQ